MNKLKPRQVKKLSGKSKKAYTVLQSREGTIPWYFCVFKMIDKGKISLDDEKLCMFLWWWFLLSFSKMQYLHTLFWGSKTLEWNGLLEWLAKFKFQVFVFCNYTLKRAPVQGAWPATSKKGGLLSKCAAKFRLESMEGYV